MYVVMKKRFYFFIAIIAMSFGAKGQLPEGAIAPDFTFTDINGRPQHLYDYLNSGKYVAIDVFATWCGWCWDYHATSVMDSIYALHDIAGDNTWRVLEMEMDGSTDMASLNGTGNHTQGNWLAGTVNPIMNPPAGSDLDEFVRTYHIRFIPQLMLICPNKQVIVDTINAGDRATVAVWEYAASIGCASLPPAGTGKLANNQPFTIYPNPTTQTLTITSSDKITTVGIYSLIGQVMHTQQYNTSTAQLDVADLPAGVYILKINESEVRRFVKQ
jgi:thiol-disulfide isomerase/thioredoxin